MDETPEERTEREASELAWLRDKHAGDPAYEGLESPLRMRRQEMLDLYNDEGLWGW